MTTNSIFFIDSRVAVDQTLLAGLPATSQWFVLNAEEDGIAQMLAVLANFHDLDAIHILSHGAEGALTLGSTVLDLDTMAGYGSQLREIGGALTESGDIALYGCNVAHGAAGEQFVNTLAQLTGADVAASDNVTGWAGDWRLEVNSGAIDQAQLLGAAAMAGYEGNLAIINGTANDDTLAGNYESDTIEGLAGNDSLWGMGGNDIIYGGDGNDTLDGGSEADILMGDAGNDFLNGGSGADSMAGGDGNDQYTVDDPGDLLYEMPEATPTGTSGGFDLVNSYLTTYVLPDFVENGRIRLATAANITGNFSNNILYAGSGDNVLNGSYGTDYVSYHYSLKAVTVDLSISGAQDTGGSGLDTLVDIENVTGSRRDDTLTGNSGANVINGNLGADTMTGGDGSDRYYVNDAGDIVIETNADAASGGTDHVSSYLAAYSLGANVENGRIHADTAADLTGNDLNNTLYAGSGDNTLDGGSGIDTVSYIFSTGGVAVDLSQSGPQTTGGSGSDTLVDIENLIGSQHNDTLTGTSDRNILYGAAGADTMVGGDGSDLYYVDDLGDVVTETNADAASGGMDHVSSYLGFYTLPDNVENGRIRLATDATLTGNDLNNTLYGGSGPIPVPGSVQFAIYNLDGADGIDRASFIHSTVAITADISLTYQPSLAYANDYTWGAYLVNIENLDGSNFNDLLLGNSERNTLNGRGGADTMIGGDGNDLYYVDDAGDVVYEPNPDPAAGGIDCVVSTIASFTLPDGIENGRLGAGVTADLIGNALDNILYAGSGDNLLDGGWGVDTASYNSRTTAVTVDLSISGAQDTGGSGHDTLMNIDNLTGSIGDDVLTGNDGDNVIGGGLGNDTMTGGLGTDTFDFNYLKEMGTTSGDCDVITDFLSGVDLIDLSTLDADTGISGNQAFTGLIDSATDFSTAGELKLSGDLLYGNTDSDIDAEFAIELTGVSSVVLTDFIV